MILVNINVSIYRTPLKYTVDMLKISNKMVFMAPGYKEALFKTVSV